MSTTIPRTISPWLVYGLPLLVILTAVILALSPLPAVYPELSAGITYDLTLTAPLLYLLLIRKTKIPKITVLPVFIFGMLIASLLLPEGQQFHLQLVRQWLLPVVEVSVLCLVGYKTYKGVRAYRARRSSAPDFLTTLRKIAEEVIGHPRVANVLAFEIAVIYYVFFSWRRRPLTIGDYTYHRRNGIGALFGVIIFLLLIETMAAHLLVARWSETVAWVLSLSTVYVVFQIFAHLRAVTQRPITVKEGRLVLRYGLFGDSVTPLDNVRSVELTRKMPPGSKDITKLALLKELENHNVILYFREPVTITGMYGLKRTARTVLLHVDRQEAFQKQIEAGRTGQ